MTSDYLLAQTDALWPRLAAVHEDGLHLDKRGLKRQPAALQRRIIQRAYQTLTGSAEGLELAHVDAALALLSATPGKHVPLNALASLPALPTTSCGLPRAGQ